MAAVANLGKSELQRVNFSRFEPAVQVGLRELMKAYELALDAQRDKWDFAIELKTLRRCGLTESHFRWLVCKGMVEHAREVNSDETDHRKFRSTNALKFTKRTCFVLTSEFFQECVDSDAAVVGSYPSQTARLEIDLLPRWDGRRHALYVANYLVKRFRWPAKNQETVLTALGEECWPTDGIDDPLPPHPTTDPKQRLRDTIKCLNRHQENPFVRFRGNGTGERVVWEFTAKSIELLGANIIPK